MGRTPNSTLAYRTLITNWANLTGPASANVAMEWNNLSTVLRVADRLDEAEQVHRTGLEMQQKLKDKIAEANSLNNLATVLLGQGKVADAERMFHDAVELIEKEKGPEDALLVKPLRTMAVLRQNADDLAADEDLARRCLTICEKRFSDEWPQFDAQSVLGGILAARRADADAEPLLLSGFEGLEERANRIPANNKARVRQACERLIHFYETTGKLGPAAE